jgi:hypothetical protein
MISILFISGIKPVAVRPVIDYGRGGEMTADESEENGDAPNDSYGSVAVNRSAIAF